LRAISPEIGSTRHSPMRSGDWADGGMKAAMILLADSNENQRI
jgi:hypothetical protein